MWIYPSGDVHLVRTYNPVDQPPTANLRVALMLRPAGQELWVDASKVPGLTTVADPATADPNVTHVVTGFTGSSGPAAFVTVTRSAVSGRSFHIVETRTTTTNQVLDNGIVRISTHDDVGGLFAGDRSLSIFSGESDRVVSVFAQFTDRPPGAVEDVTGHAWLRYTVANTTLASVDIEGRIRGLSPGNTTIEVFLWDNRFHFTVNLTVKPALILGPSEIRSEQLVRRRSSNDRNIYVLAEGYTNESRFFEHARRAVKVWLETEPYKMLAHRFNVVGIFQASADRGMTITSPLISAPVGCPSHQRLLWQGGGAAAPTAVALTRNTVFGLRVGTRLSTPELARVRGDNTLPIPVLFATPRVLSSFVSPDDRRLPRFGTDGASSFQGNPPHIAFESLVRRYIEAARHPVTSQDRAVFLIDDSLRVGTVFDVLALRPKQLPSVGLSIGHAEVIDNVTASGPLFDRTIDDPGYIEQATGSVIAHELAHTYRLADEYEKVRRRSYTLNVDDDDFENVQHDRSLRLRIGSVDNPNPLRGDDAVVPVLLPSKLDITRIKWNIHRVAKISPAVQFNAVDRQVTLAVGQAIRWKSGERAFLRNNLAVLKIPINEPRVTAIEIRITSIDLAQEMVTFSNPMGVDLTSLGSLPPLLYVPAQNKSHVDLSLIDPTVLSFLADKGPFPKNQPCGVGGGPKEWNKERPCPEILGFKRPSPHANAIGLYEGGGDLSCDIYRPAGRCKMRTSVEYTRILSRGSSSQLPPPNECSSHELVVKVIDFCFVCKYVLVDLIDPAQHERLDKDYPKDC